MKVKMAAESNMSFHQEEALGSALHQHAITFQSGAVNSTSEIIPVGNYYGLNSSTANVMFCDNNNVISTSSPATTPTGNPSSSLLLDSVPGLKNEIGLAAEWSEDEQYRLEEGLVKFKDEPNIMKYIKIAATLPEKTVRDVALRCRWMTRKRRKQEESNSGRKGNYRKDKFGESSSKTNSSSIPNMAAYSIPLNQIDQNQRVKCEGRGSEMMIVCMVNAVSCRLSQLPGYICAAFSGDLFLLLPPSEFDRAVRGRQFLPSRLMANI